MYQTHCKNTEIIKMSHATTCKGRDTPAGISWVSFCFHIMAYSMASVSLNKTYNIQIAMNMRNDIVVDRNEFMSHGNITRVGANT